MAVVVSMLLCISGATQAAASQPQEFDDADKLADPAAVVQAFMTVRQWVNEFDTPGIDDASAKAELKNASAVCVILRRDGRVIGTAVDDGGDELMLRRAAAQAMSQVLADSAVQGMTSRLIDEQDRPPGDGPAPMSVQDFHAQLGRSLTVEIEVAGRLAPLVGRSIDQMSRSLEPGLDGIAFRQGSRWEFRFPAQLRATNTGGDPGKTLLNLVIQSGVPLKEFGNLQTRNDLGLYRFRTINLAQRTPAGLPFQLHRGDVLVSRADVDPQSIGEFATRIVEHMLVSMWPEPPAPPEGLAPVEAARQPLGIMGDYIVVADQYRPFTAPAVDQGLAAWALLHYSARSGLLPNAHADAVESARRAGEQILRDLAVSTAAEQNPRGDVLACAAIVYAVSQRVEALNDPAINELFTSASEQLVESLEPAGGFTSQIKSQVPVHGQAMIAAALARCLSMTNAPGHKPEPDSVRQALDEVWKANPPAQHVALLPWIGWAEVDLARATNQPVQRADELRALMKALHESRIDSSAAMDSPDLDGGFALTTEGPASSAPRATSQTLRPAAWLAGALVEPAVNTPQPAAQDTMSLHDHLRTVRFAMQLALRDQHLGLVRNARRALGGIRSSLWDSDQPLAAQCLALVTAMETLQTRDALLKQQTKAKPN